MLPLARRLFARQPGRRPLRRVRPALEELEARVVPAVDVLTYHNDAASTGQNLAETALTPANVNATSFGRVFARGVDGQVYAQPLVLTGVSITTGPRTGVHDVVFVATEHDSLYAFDANDGQLLWHDLLHPSRYGGTVTPVPSADVGSGAIVPEIGITSTPVIDPATGTIYVEEKTKEVAGGVAHYLHWLSALDVGSGAQQFGGPVVIADSVGDTYLSGPTVTGTGANPHGAPAGQVAFDSFRQLNRSALTLVNGSVYVAFASHGDNMPYHGWVLGFGAADLKPTAVFNATPNGGLGGIWESGGGLVSDAAGNLYMVTGNGTFDTTRDTGGFPLHGDYGDSVVKLAVDPNSSAGNQNGNLNGWGLKVVDYFTPFNQAQLDSADLDLGSGGPLLLPDAAGSASQPHLLVVSGKEGRIYLIDRDHMGQFDPTPVNNLDQNIVQELPPGTIGRAFDTPAYFNGQIYYAAEQGLLKAFSISGAQLSSVPTSRGPDAFGLRGSTPTISANGATNGIVWAVDGGSNALRAYDPGNLAHELYTSNQVPARDALGSAVKFSVATEANGHVYIGTSNGLVAYAAGPNVTATVTGTSLQITKTLGANLSLRITHASGFQALTLSTGGNGTINNTATTFTTPGPITAVVVRLGAGDDLLTLDGNASGAIQLTGALSISGSGGNKTITLLNTHLLAGAGLNLSLAGNGIETATFTDVDVSGTASVSHAGSGDTALTIATSNNPNTLNRWGSLSISNGVGADMNLISDTDFAGGVSIRNGPGNPANLGPGGGSQTRLFAANHTTLLRIGGGLMIGTASGQSDSEVDDYDVGAGVTINTGPGMANQTSGNVVGLGSRLALAGAIPAIGGSVLINGTAVAGTTPGLLLDLGTASPLTINGGLAINATGTGSVTINLQDLQVPSGATSVVLGGQTAGDVVSVSGSTLKAVFNGFRLTSAALGNNSFDFQNQAGEIDFGGAVLVQLGSGSDTLNLAANTSSRGGVPNAVVEFLANSLFDGGQGTNGRFEGTGVFSVFAPQFRNFTLNP
jgi:hypothetical protein